MLKLVWERWKKVPDLEYVKVSNLGNVKINGKAVRPTVSDKGYFVIECEDKYFFVHRLVAKAFLKHNLEKYDTIDHIAPPITVTCTAVLKISSLNRITALQ